MEHNDTFHTSAHCDLTVWSIFWGDGVWWHLSHLCLWPHCKWAEVWKVSSYSIHSINYAYSEVTMSRGVKGVIILLPLNKYFIQWGHIEKKYERLHRLLREWSIMTLFTPLLVTSLYEVFIERMEHNDTLHTSAVTSYSFHSINTLYSEVTLRKSMKGCIVLHPLNKLFIQLGHKQRCERWRTKYLLRGWSVMTSFTPLLIVTSLYEEFIEWMEYDATFHTSAHCERLHRTPSTQ
jgi:hypothetical protein